MSVRVRFAPSPTGYLHVGNVRTALFNWLFARQRDGVFILRVEDTDAQRSRDQYEEQMATDLAWLGLNWDEGIGCGGDYGPYRQTRRMDLYKRYAFELMAAGNAYYCFCAAAQLEDDRKNQLAAEQTVRYVGRCSSIEPDDAAERVAAGEKATVRLRVREGSVGFEDLVFGPLQIESGSMGDFILLRSDGSARYNLACVVDDALMKISHVVRGEGHISNTYRQLVLFEYLGWKPPQYAHLSTILGPDGSKLSKRHGATSISDLRELGYLPEALLNYLSLLGWSPPSKVDEILTVDQIVEAFDLRRVQLSPATFDPEKLKWVNRSHLKVRNPREIMELALPFLVRDGLIPSQRTPELEGWLEDLMALLVNYVDRLSDLPGQARTFLSFNPVTALDNPEVGQILSQEGAVQVITSFAHALSETEVDPVGLEEYAQCVRIAMKKTGLRGKHIFRPLRVAITGRSSGPELDRLIRVLEAGKNLELPIQISGIRDRVNELLKTIDQAKSSRQS